MAKFASKLPTVDSVTTINEDGSRYIIHPADVRGKFTLWRRIFGVALLVVYVLLPWIKINGHPAVFMDVEHRKFYLLGFMFAVQDIWLGFFALSGLGFTLFYLTALFGRLWCGWACPYTVFLEHIFRRIERWVDGDAASRRKLAASPLTRSKVVRRALKYGLYLLAAAAIAHIFLSYFVSLPRLWSWMRGDPAEHWFAFGVVVFLTGVLYFCFAWFREQFCIILCPYGRLQSALTDENTMVIGYDKRRGEPRGKAGTAGVGDCVNCLRCVQVCPTGIDIRNGLQLECIGCAACVDACDEIMRKLDRKPGLVRYDSLQGLEGKKTKWLRPRIYLYTALMALGGLALGFSLTRLKPYQATLKRLQGIPYFYNEKIIRNQFQLRITNKKQESRVYTLALEGAPTGTQLIAPSSGEPVAGEAEFIQTVIVEMPLAAYDGTTPMELVIRSQKDNARSTLKFEFAGPNAQLLKATTKPAQP